jgi:hypothetical protein
MLVWYEKKSSHGKTCVTLKGVYVFRKLVALYRDFAIDGRRAEEVVKELLYLSEHLGIMDAKLESAILKAFKTESMLDVEIAKEIFHDRLKLINKSLLGGVDPFALFS